MKTRGYEFNLGTKPVNASSMRLMPQPHIPIWPIMVLAALNVIIWGLNIALWIAK